MEEKSLNMKEFKKVMEARLKWYVNSEECKISYWSFEITHVNIADSKDIS